MTNTIEYIDFHDVDQFMECAAATMDIRSIQLQPGKLCMKNQILQLDDVVISHYASNRKMLEFLSIFPQHMQFVLTSSEISGAQWCGIDIPVNSLVLLHPGLEHQALIPANWDAFEIQIKDETIIQESLLFESQWQQTLKRQHAVFQHQTEQVAVLRQLLQSIFRSAQQLDLLAKNIEAKVILRNKIIDDLRMIMLERQIEQGLQNSQTREYRFRTVSRAFKFVDNHLDEQFSVQHMCEQIGTTPRTLQIWFQEFLGISPLQYIQSCRLHRIQQELFNARNAAMPVCHIAQQYGMSHAGRFSQQYKRMFAESPHAAMKRRHSQ